MIDFPASPTDGQVFSATNGVVYKYSATYQSWLAQSAPPVLGGTGQVTAISTATTALVVGTDVVIPFATVQSGNAGLWWNTNRYTPPAGSYFISANLSINNMGGGNATALLKLRKNGTAIGGPLSVSMASGFWAPNSVGEYVDANGTDFFDVVVNLGAGSAATNVFNAIFSAFPLSGIQGPTGGPPGPVVGDFFANFAGPIPAAAQTILFPTIVTGNSGAYYNPATGRYTPPAGRYRIFACLSGSASAGAASQVCTLRKNGVAVLAESASVAAAYMWGAACVDGIFDVNGTDWFDIQNGGTLWDRAGTSWFGAYPTQGMVGPRGPAGVISNGYRLIQRIVPTAGQATVDFTNIPSDINDLEVRWDVTPTANDVDFVMRFYNASGVLVTAATYNAAVTQQNSSSGVGSGPPVVAAVPGGASLYLTYAIPTRRVNNSASQGGIRGVGWINDIWNASRIKSINQQSDHLSGDSQLWMFLTGGGIFNTAMAISGIQLAFSGTTFAAGGAISLWGSP